MFSCTEWPLAPKVIQCECVYNYACMWGSVEAHWGDMSLFCYLRWSRVFCVCVCFVCVCVCVGSVICFPCFLFLNAAVEGGGRFLCCYWHGQWIYLVSCSLCLVRLTGRVHYTVTQVAVFKPLELLNLQLMKRFQTEWQYYWVQPYTCWRLLIENCLTYGTLKWQQNV